MNASSRILEADPDVMLAYEEARARGRYNIFDSWPIVREMNEYLVSVGREPLVDVFAYQAMVLRFMDDREHYARCLKYAQRTRGIGGGGGGAKATEAVTVA